MKKLDIDTLKNFLLVNDCPILIEDIPNEIFEDSVILCNDCDVSELNGHYEGIDFVPPTWYKILTEKSKNQHSILIINQINSIPLNEQLKFTEILKYRKISTFDLPTNCSVIVTCSDLQNKPISEEIYSLVAHI